MPSKDSRVCSCHFREGEKSNGPEIFERNKDKLFTEQRGPPPKKQKTVPFKEKTITELVEQAKRNEPPSLENDNEQRAKSTQEVILEAELDLAKRELENLEEKLHYKNRCYTVTELPRDVIWMETGLPTKDVFDIVVRHASRFKDSIN